MLKKLALCALLLAPVQAWACANPVTIKDGSGNAQNIGVTVDGGANCYPNAAIVDGSNAANKATVDSNLNLHTAAALQAITTGGASITSTQVANNTTAIVIKASAGTLYGVEAYNNSTNTAYIKIYNLASNTCGTGTPAYRAEIPAVASAAGTGGGFINPVPAVGVAFGTGIVLCVTSLYADSDTTAPAASAFIVNVYFK